MGCGVWRRQLDEAIVAACVTMWSGRGGGIVGLEKQAYPVISSIQASTHLKQPASDREQELKASSHLKQIHDLSRVAMAVRSPVDPATTARRDPDLVAHRSRIAPSDLGHRPQHRSPADLAPT
ncbi:hypothetical protein ACLOJK_004143 [Asimina triloba]